MRSGDAAILRPGEWQPVESQANCMTKENSNLRGCQLHDDRWRELFPIPLCAETKPEAGLSVSARRRRARVRSTVDKVNSVIKILNEMYSPSRDGEFCSAHPVTSAQYACQHELFKDPSKQKSPTKFLTMREAAQELLLTDLSYSGEVTTTVRPYDRGLLSIPSTGNQAVDLRGVLDDVGRETIEDPLRCMLLSDDEFGSMVEKQQPICTYMDPTLRDSLPTYCTFIQDLFLCGMVEFTNRPSGLVTPFCVAKKSGKLRLILDCRDTNRRFRPPPTLAAGTGASWARLSIPEGRELFVAQSDIKDYFYSLQLPESLRSLFCMPPIPASLLRHWGVSAEHGGSLVYDGWAHPRLRVVPMGWSWAMWLSQRVHQVQSQIGAGISQDRVLVDGKPAPDLSDGQVLLLPYADNLNVAGVDQRRVQMAKDGAVKRLREVGLLVHEEMDACTVAQSLGYCIDGVAGTVRPVADPLHTVQLAFKWLSRRPRVTGLAIQKLLGHAVHFMLLRRELLSIPRRLYDFVQYAGQSRRRLWAVAAVEARWIGELLSLSTADLRRVPSTQLTSSDASLSGIAVCSKQESLSTVLALGSFKEGWRFKGRNPADRPRQRALGRLDPFTDPESVKPIGAAHEDPLELVVDFPEVDPLILKKEDWQLRFAQYMQHPEAITVLEGRAVVATLRHKFRSLACFRQRHVHLCDNLGTVLALEKGRSPSPPLLRVCRRVACLLLATSSSLNLRWIPSEINVADEGSRRWERSRKAHGSESTSSKKEAGSKQQTSSSTMSPKQHQRGKSREKNHLHEREPIDPAIQRSDIPGTKCNLHGGGRGLQASDADFSKVCEGTQAFPSWAEEVGREFLLLSEQSLRGRERHWRCNKAPRGPHRQRAGLHRQGQPPPLEAMLARMAPPGPGCNSSSHAMGADCSHSHEAGSEGVDRSSLASPPHVRCLPETRGGLELAKRRLGGADSATPLLQPQPASIRPTGKFKSRTIRRDHPPRFEDDPLDGAPAASSSKPPSGGDDLSGGLSRTARCLAGRTSRLGPLQDAFRAISTETQWSLLRSDGETSQPFGCQEERQVVVGQFSAALRSERATQPGVPEASKESTASCYSGTPAGGAMGPKIFLPEKAKDRKLWFLEIFSGSAHLSKAMVQQGFRCAAWDIEYNSRCNVLDKEVLCHLLRFLRGRKVALVWFGMPCQSWSRARRFDGGPPPLRDDNCQIWGRSGLSFSDRQKLHLGNKLLLWTTMMAQLCSTISIPWVIENPGRSRCWLTPDFGILMKTAELVFVDYCQYHVPWRKNTGFLTHGFPRLATILRTCCPIKGRCSATHKRHIILSGRDANNVWWTHRAQPYPPELCHDIAVCLGQST